MMNVKGKVQNGVMEVVAVQEGRVVGMRKPMQGTLDSVQVIPSVIDKSMMELSVAKEPVTPVVPEVKVTRLEDLVVDSPFISMVNANRIRYVQEENARYEELKAWNKKQQRKQAILEFFGLN